MCPGTCKQGQSYSKRTLSNTVFKHLLFWFDADTWNITCVPWLDERLTKTHDEQTVASIANASRRIRSAMHIAKQNLAEFDIII